MWKICEKINRDARGDKYELLQKCMLKGQCHGIVDPQFFSPIDYP
jgi:hypothetical protein